MSGQHKTRWEKTLWLWSLVAVISLLAAGCGAISSLQPASLTHIVVLYTNDEHGWMATDEKRGGAAGMLERWRSEEGYTADGPFLVLSGGDNWTGPALSTWFEGASMVEVMNLMGYEATAIGNHEFDFGIAGLRQREAEAEFAFLAANVLDTATGTLADFALPYIVVEVSGLNVGILGLASQHTPQTTMPTHISGLEFTDYAPALRDAALKARDDGAEVLILISHLCGDEMQALIPTLKALGIGMIGGGHCHERIGRVTNGVALVEAGWQMAAYGRVDLFVEPESSEIQRLTVALKSNPPGQVDSAVAQVVATWQAELDDALEVPIGYTRDGLSRESAALHNLVTDAWLEAYPADIAMSNAGGFRQGIDPGEITLADVVSVLPFDNVLIDVALTGEQVIASYMHGTRRPAVAGLQRSGGRYFVAGEPLDLERVYHVLVNDYMYAGGDGYRLAEYDPQAYHTGIDWRQPVVTWISSRHTSPADPLENYLDFDQR